jgi:hypothetical protein
VYSRSMTNPPKNIVQKGKAKFGTFSPVPGRLDIRGIQAPFAGIPIPSFITNIRIKSRLEYVFSVGNYIGLAEFFDDKVFGLADIIFWNRETGKKFYYHTFMSARRRFVPVKTDKAACSSFRRSRYIRIAWNRPRNRISLVFNMHETALFPPVTGYLFSSFSNSQLQEFVSVTPAPITSRCSATWIMNMTSRGAITIKNWKTQPALYMQDTNSLSCMILNRMYYKFHTRSKMAYGIGIADSRKIIFRFINTTADSIDADHYNDNMLTIDGTTTLIPPVCITHSFGIDKKWIIQDTESMVDLEFSPISINQRNLSIAFVRTAYSTVYGLFNGVLLSESGEKILLKDFPGIVRNNMLRL